jgi:tetratricopeptide (TPR) repeat protein
MNTRSTTAAVLALVCGAVLPLAAMYFAPEIDNVPVDRLIANLERAVAEKPDDPHLRLNLARTHAMAFATKSDTLPVGRGMELSGGWVPGTESRLRIPPPKSTTDPARLAVARSHLSKAIQRYEEAIRLARNDLAFIARLGHAWCVELSGDRPRAIELYRRLIADAWEVERRMARGVAMPVTVEAAGYFIPLLDPVKDKAEIDTLRARVDELNRLPRAITPVAIPLRAGMDAWDVVDHAARVRFDADGSGHRKLWSWIARDAGWLVYEQRGSDITSALQLFGGVTFWLFWENGYQPMRALDDDDDGRLVGTELRHLSIWRDANQNGVSERGEVRPLEAWDVAALSYAHEIAEDAAAIAVAPRGVTFRDGSTRPTFDVLLYEHPSTKKGTKSTKKSR